MDFAIGRVFVATAHGEFVAVEFAQRDHACPGVEGFTILLLAFVAEAESRHHRGVKRAVVVLQHFAAGGGGPAARHENIFVRNGHAGERRGCTGGDAFIGLPRLCQRGLCVDTQISTQSGLGLAARQIVLRQFHGAGLLAG